MNRFMALLLAVAVIQAFLTDDGQAQSGVNNSEQDVWRFRVWLGKRDIGFHEFKVNHFEDQEQVEIEADFSVRILGIKVYNYAHQNREQWVAGCLENIESTTNDNGKEFRVEGIERDTHSDCLKSYAYWNPEILKSDVLMNSQTGELEPVFSRWVGVDLITIGAEEIEADRFDLVTDRGDITLWYGRTNSRWLALETIVKGNKLLRYEALDIPTVSPRRQAYFALTGN